MNGREPLCPRCGYDLTGLIASWSDSCPMRALCSECGLDFDCGRVLSPQLLGPPWCMEHSAKASSRRWWATSWVALNPWRLCRELEVDHEVHMGRLIRFWVLWLVQCHLITAAVLIIMGGSGGGYAWVGELEQYCWRELPPPIAGFAAPLLVPFAYAVEVQVPISAPPGWGSLIAQEEIPIAPIAALVFLPVLLMPMWTVLLDTTFRMARVRRLHLLRGIAYSLPGAVAAFVVLLAFFIVWTRVYRPVTWNQPQWLAATLGLAYLAYHVAWWQRFVARYLRLRHANAVVAVHFFMTSIVLVAVWAIMYSWEIV